jgi:hypothetical protein
MLVEVKLSTLKVGSLICLTIHNIKKVFVVLEMTNVSEGAQITFLRFNTTTNNYSSDYDIKNSGWPFSVTVPFICDAEESILVVS